MYNFRRKLYGEALELCDHIKQVCASMVLKEQKDVIEWTLTGNGVYTVKSYYRFLIQPVPNTHIIFCGKLKMPPRVKVFMWLVLRNSILTKDNLLCRGWTGDSKCSICGGEETVSQLFFHRSIAKLLWNIMKCAFDMFDILDSVHDLFNSWVKKINKNDRGLVVVGISTIFWTLWKLRNRVVFYNNRVTDPFVPVNMILK